ncbi:PREDICTED: GRB2-associated-binding protein 2 [Nicrophorus vespilloides]|uniref:GRB2-associated-binding protein 2 n=1 Tax=Nicrophorus vespilloides TaxID=110193 RepID=A0ABM1NCW5_NICVS|nr:PREDICTED: GRB2-associated-binding protein 2 [Nicrophorus vespilloides]
MPNVSGPEILNEGWLTKSPPTKRIWRGRWRKRWFTLHAGEIPGQYILSYYTDRKSRKLKGSINLDQCEQVDRGFKFEDKNLKFDYMFNIKTPSRTYYLAADTEPEMELWVKCICKICSLQVTSEIDECTYQDELAEIQEKSLNTDVSSPISSSPYILVSECITGKTPILPNQPIEEYNALQQQNIKSYYGRPRNHANESYDSYDPVPAPTYLNFGPKAYDTPRLLQAPPKGSQEEVNYCYFIKNNFGSPLQSPTDTESVFTDDDWSHNVSAQTDSNKSTRPSNSSSVDVDSASQQLNNFRIPDVVPLAPPRPPKPSHIAIPQTYHNLQCSKTIKSDGSKSGTHSKSNSNSDQVVAPINDEMYDFPRSHHLEMTNDVRGTLSRRHCYNNAAPSSIDGHIFTYDASPKPSTSTNIFQYGDDLVDEPASPISQNSSTTAYSNLPSPILLDTPLMPPPVVNRCLKPKRKLSDTRSIASSTAEPPSPRPAPCVDRKLKPTMTFGTMPCQRKAFEVEYDNVSRRHRAAPSPTPPSLGRSYESLVDYDNEQIYHSFPDLNKSKILEYLDLDLDSKSNKHVRNAKAEPLRSPGANTVYKKVDFMKTEAFNNTRNELEKERNKNVPILKK